MSAALNLFKKHPVAMIFLTIYTLLGIRIVIAEFQVRQQIKRYPGMIGIATGEANLYLLFYMAIFAVIFFMVCCGYAIAKRKETSF